jgi:chromate reductase, NAD(P)H dehydrogenase (quinone)
MRILAVSGSLRAASSNTALLLAAASLVPSGVEITLYRGLGDLPHFNPELEASDPPSVREWRMQLQGADGVLISTPEYAHGVPGTLKNALDWVVGSGEFMGKPVALLNTSVHATHAQASLSQTISVMDARLVTDPAFAIPLPGNKIDVEGILGREELEKALQRALEVFVRSVESLGDWG